MQSRRSAAVIGPVARPYAPEECICGVLYGCEWAHRQTRHHKHYEADYRKRQRLERLKVAMAWGEIKPGTRKWKRAQGYLKEAA